VTEPYSVPIVPGNQPQYVADTPVVVGPQPQPPKRRRRWLIPALAGVVLILAAGGTIAFLAFRKPDAIRSAVNQDRPLAAAWRACGGNGELSDGDRTLFLDMRGKEDTAGLSADEIACVLNQLKTPDFVVREMEETRALDGRQTDHWGSFEASWSYHPDQGLDVLIREK
jgi:hypothetical protein